MSEFVKTFDMCPQSQNAYYRIFKNRFVITREGKEYRRRIREELGEVKQIRGLVRLDIHFEFKDKRLRDLDNYHKCFIDAIKNLVIEDDCMINELFLKKTINTGRNRVTLRVTPIALKGE